MSVKTAPMARGQAKYSRVHTTDVNGDLTVSFPAGLFAQPPVVLATIVSTSVNDQYFAEVVGAPTASEVVIKVRKMVGLSLNILSLGLISLFSSPGARDVHVVAYEEL